MYGTRINSTGKLLFNQAKMQPRVKMLWQGTIQCCKVHTCKQKIMIQSTSYCKLRLVAQAKRSIHTAHVLCAKTNETEETKSPPAMNTPLGREQNESGGKAIVQLLKPPSPEVEEIQTHLPTDDKKRITPENRKMALKASLIFKEIADSRGANKQTFHLAMKTYMSQESLYRRGAVEFIYAGLAEMKNFGVIKDLPSYKELLKIFPEGKMIPRNIWQVEFMHYPRQQQCGIDLLEQMEHNSVMPDEDFGKLLRDRFGSAAHVTRKLRRMMYWLPKFKNMNPYPIPQELPDDPVKLALIALRRMCVDMETTYNVFKTQEVDPSGEEDTFIASAQSPIQLQLISKHKTAEPLFVEGPYPVYLRNIGQQYFILRAEPNINALMKEKQKQKAQESDEDLFEWTNFFDEEKSDELQPIRSVHEQEDSTILALCITGTSTKSSVVTWIRCLEKQNPNLAETPVLFKLISPNSTVDVIGDNRPFHELQKV